MAFIQINEEQAHTWAQLSEYHKTRATESFRVGAIRDASFHKRCHSFLHDVVRQSIQEQQTLTAQCPLCCGIGAL